MKTAQRQAAFERIRADYKHRGCRRAEVTVSALKAKLPASAAAGRYAFGCLLPKYRRAEVLGHPAKLGFAALGKPAE
jgi:hypothetical protein